MSLNKVAEISEIEDDVGTEFVNLRYDQLANMHNPAQDITQAYFHFHIHGESVTLHDTSSKLPGIRKVTTLALNELESVVGN
jgi:hypothetical protein